MINEKIANSNEEKNINMDTLTKLRIAVISIFALSTISFILVFIPVINFFIPTILIMVAYILLLGLMIKLLLIKEL